jgi:hypothetical protein
MGYTCAYPIAKIAQELGAERKGNSISSTAATPEILNNVIWMHTGNKILKDSK